MSDTEYEEKPLKITEYRAPGPVALRCLRSRTFIRAIMGPVGSGKTTLCLFDALDKAFSMPKAKDGHRYFAGVVIRDTYTNLWATAIKSWNKFFPQSMGQWSGGMNRPAEHRLAIRDIRDNSIVHIIMRFTALSDGSVEDTLRGAEFTWAYVNEADRVVEDVLTYLVSRVGRYPDQMMMGGKPFWSGIILDVNPPDTDSWIYRRFVEEKADGDEHEFFIQPGGRDPRAENVANLTQGYYARQIAANAGKKWWIRRMVDGKFGYSRDGLPVYDTFDDDLHVAREPLAAEPGLPLILGFDQGITQPAMAVMQYMPVGQMRWIGEYLPGRMGASTFGQNCRAYLNANFPGAPIRAPATCDPAGMSGEVREDAHVSWAAMVQKELGVVIQPAETNEFDPRFESLNQLFTYMPAPGVPGFLLSPACKHTRKGLNSHYRYRKKQGLDNDFEPRPQKNLWANIIEAGQYAALDLFGRQGIIGGGVRDGMKPRDGALWQPDYPDLTASQQRPGDFDVYRY